MMRRGSWLKTANQLKICAQCVVSAMSGPVVLQDGDGKVIKSKNSGHRTFVLEDTLRADIKEGLLADRLKKQNASEESNSRASISLIYESDEGANGECGEAKQNITNTGKAGGRRQKDTARREPIGVFLGTKSDLELLSAKKLNSIEMVKAIVGDSKTDQDRAVALLKSNNFDVEATMGIWFAGNESDDDSECDSMPDLLEVSDSI